MAVKVVYDATRGLVQENDSTGAGGFDIQDAFISQGSETVNAAAAATNADISARGVSIVTATAAGGLTEVELQNGTSVGQQKIIISAANSDAALEVKSEANADIIAAGDTFGAGDVALCIWTGTAWRVAASS